MSAQRADIKVDGPGPDVWVLADDAGPVDLRGATVTRTVIGPRPSLAIVVANVPTVAQGGRGHVACTPVVGERVAGWLGYRFRVQWGPGNDQVKFFPDDGPRWVLVA